METSSDQSENNEQAFMTYRRVIITAIAGLGVFIAVLLLVVMVLHLKAYKSFLQRLVIVLILSTMLEDGCRASSIFFHLTNTTNTGYGCEILGFFTVTFHWYTYMLCLLWMAYLLAIVGIQTRRINLSVIMRLKGSRISQLLLEFGVFTGVLATPAALILWMPFYIEESSYGYNQYICTIRSQSNNTINTFVAGLFVSAPILLTGFFTILLFIGMALLYCFIPAELKLARHAIRNLVIFSLCLTTFAAIFLTISQVLKLFRAPAHVDLVLYSIYLAFTTLGKFLILIGYLLAFHCWKRRRRYKLRLKLKLKAEYGTFKESARQTAASFTYFTIPYTGQFETSSPSN